MKIATVVGARPQFVKLSMVSKYLKDINNVEQVIIHTGQHFNKMMSSIFFDECFSFLEWTSIKSPFFKDPFTTLTKDTTPK